MQLFALRQRITNLKDSIIWQAHDIAWPSLIDSLLALSHKLSGAAETHCLTITNVQIRSVTDKLTRANLAESNTTAMVGVDVGCYLEDKACEFVLFRLHLTLLSLRRTWIGSYLYEAIQQFLNAKVVKG